MTFKATRDGAALDLISSPMTSITATIAGPNTDFASYWQATIQGSGATGTLVAAGTAGEFDYTVPAAAALPANAKGSFTLGLEGYLQPTGGERSAAFSPVLAFAVTDPAPVARRTIVDSAKCNDCHRDLAGHGGSRKNAQYCVMCHNPNNPGDERISRFESAEIFVESVSLGNMVHRIHAGEHLSRTHIYGGFPAPSAANPAGTPIDFGHVLYPNDLANCTACHAGASYAVPTAEGLLPAIQQIRTCTEDPAADADNYCTNPFFVVAETIALPPVTAACTGCHDQTSTLAHAEVMTTSLGVESCAACHGPGNAFDVASAHGLD
jgi:OmcA/MtrC family decaheme c-type cytochrome